MFEAIVEHNERIEEYRASGDPVRIATVKWQRPVGPTSLNRIRETLRAILSPRVKQGLLTVNVAKFVELPPAVRPKETRILHALKTPDRRVRFRRPEAM